MRWTRRWPPSFCAGPDSRFRRSRSSDRLAYRSLAGEEDPMRGTRSEISTRAKDDSLQGVGGDPYGSPYYFGIPIPAVPTTVSTSRYLVQLARRQFNAHE